MTNYQFIKGVEIISMCIPKDEMESDGVQFEHDQVYFGKAEWITDENVKDELIGLGWFLDDEFECWSAFS